MIHSLEDRVRAAIESSPAAMLLVDGRGRIRYSNSRATGMFGLSRTELHGLEVESLIPGPVSERHRAYREAYMAAPQARPMGAGRELHARRADGRVFPVEIGLTPLPGGEEPIVLVSVIDITERKRAEAEVARRKADLETILRAISHDLRTPVRAVEGFARLLRESRSDRLDETGRDWLDRLSRAGESLRRQLDDLLTLARARALETDEERELVPGERIVADALAACVPAPDGAVTVATDLPELRVDRAWAVIALTNLVANALKYRAEGRPPDVEVAGITEGGRPGLVVRDRGTGVPEEQRERIFHLFRRGLQEDGDGTGAGLAIAREIARRHGGDVSYRPRPGGGSEFRITF